MPLNCTEESWLRSFDDRLSLCSFAEQRDDRGNKIEVSRELVQVTLYLYGVFDR